MADGYQHNGQWLASDDLGNGIEIARLKVAMGPDGMATDVSETNPLPVDPGPGGAVQATIAPGAALAPPIDLGRQRLHTITIPAEWTAAPITFRASHDGAMFHDLYDRDGEVTLSNTAVGPERSLAVDVAVFFGIRFLQIRSGTSEAPVNQAAERSLGLQTVPA